MRKGWCECVRKGRYLCVREGGRCWYEAVDVVLWVAPALVD